MGVELSSSNWILDHLHFAGDAGPDWAEGSYHTLLISEQEGVDPGHVERMRCTFYEVYPQFAARFNPAAPTRVGMIFRDEPGVAWASRNDTFYNRSHLAGARPSTAANYRQGELPIADALDDILQARGINDRISSLRVPAGLTVTVYADSFSGASAECASDTDLVGSLEDLISSIVID